MNVDLDFKIGLLAPSRAGKTTLLSAIFDDVSDKQAENAHEMNFDYGATAETQAAIDLATYEFENCFDQTKTNKNQFFNPKITPNVGQKDYEFFIRTQEKKDVLRSELSIPEMCIRVNFKDYPGGLLNNVQNLPEDLKSHFDESRVMFVPIPTDILQEYSKKEKVLSKYLAIDTICSLLKNWVTHHANQGRVCCIIFVPVKCEHCFNDNGGTQDLSENLTIWIKNIYINRLKFNANELKYVRIEIRPVDTFGICEYNHMEINNGVPVSYFKLRGYASETSSRIKVLGAFELLSSALNFMAIGIANECGYKAKNLKEIINKRTLLERIGNSILSFFGRQDPVKTSAEQMSQKRSKFIVIANHFNEWNAVSEKRQIVINAIDQQ